MHSTYIWNPPPSWPQGPEIMGTVSNQPRPKPQPNKPTPPGSGKLPAADVQILFEHIVERVHQNVEALVTAGSDTAYKAARTQYVEDIDSWMKDYGTDLKQLIVIPIDADGDRVPDAISIVAEWNPSSSSSCVKRP